MERQRTVTKSIRKRIAICAVLFGLVVLFLIATLFHLQLVMHEHYKSIANGDQLSSLTIDAPRGTIYDRDMNVLAQSATAWNVVVSPKDTKAEQREPLAKMLSETLDISYDWALSCCTGDSQYMIVRRKVEEDVCEKLRVWLDENKVKSVWFEQSTKRYYPYGNYLSSSLGFTGTDNYGLYGLEQSLDDTLAGVAGRTITARNAWGGTIYYAYQTKYDAVPGKSVVLTIDEKVQYYLEKYIEETMELFDVGNYAVGIVMNVKTGEILGITTKPDYDPNSPFTIFDQTTTDKIAAIEDEEQRQAAFAEAQKNQWINKAVSSAYYPGSVFKIITASMALESGVVDINEKFQCGGTLNVAGVTIGCNNHKSHGLQSFGQIVTNSCNVSFMRIGERLGSEMFFNYFRAFGLTERTGVDLPTEGTSVYYTADQLGPVELATSAFGQSNVLTPIQLLTAVCAAVNGGNLLEPHIVSKVIDSDGNIISETQPVVRRQVVSEETSAAIADILGQTGRAYSGYYSYTKGYRAGGKSGTAEKQGGPDNEYIASFCGFAPYDDPEIAVLALFDNPRKNSYYGGVVAAPCVGKILASILPHLGIDPVYSQSELQTVDLSVPSVREEAVNSAKNTLTNAGFSVKIIGNGETVTAQYPLQGMSVPRGSTVVLYTGGAEQQTATVPNLTGKTYKNALSVLSALGFNIRANGSTASDSLVLSQSVESGSSAPLGTVVSVELSDYSIDE